MVEHACLVLANLASSRSKSAIVAAGAIPLLTQLQPQHAGNERAAAAIQALLQRLSS